MNVYPLAPGIVKIGCCANEKPLRLIAHGAFDFSRLCLYQHWYWGKGGNSLNPIQASENIMILETNDCTSSVVVFSSCGSLFGSSLSLFLLLRWFLLFSFRRLCSRPLSSVDCGAASSFSRTLLLVPPLI